jgi:hypothetical protein
LEATERADSGFGSTGHAQAAQKQRC